MRRSELFPSDVAFGALRIIERVEPVKRSGDDDRRELRWIMRVIGMDVRLSYRKRHEGINNRKIFEAAENASRSFGLRLRSSAWGTRSST